MLLCVSVVYQFHRPLQHYNIQRKTKIYGFSGVSVPQATSTNSDSMTKLPFDVSVVYQFHRPLQPSPPGTYTMTNVSVVYQFHRPLQQTLRLARSLLKRFQWCISSTGHFNRNYLRNEEKIKSFSGVSVPQATSTISYRSYMVKIIVSVVYQFHRPLQPANNLQTKVILVSVVYQFHRPLQLRRKC